MNIGHVLTHHARFRPQHPAFIFEDKMQTYAEFNTYVNRMANAMAAAGIRKGDKVAAVLPNCPELWMLYWARPYPCNTKKNCSAARRASFTNCMASRRALLQY